MRTWTAGSGSGWRGTPSSGYTVVELMMVLVLLGLLAVIAYTRVGPALLRAQVRGASNVLATDVQYAQLLAARFGEPMRITVDAGTRQYQIGDRDGDTVFRIRRFGAGGDFHLSEFSAVPTILELFPNAIVAPAATFTLGNDGFRKRVTVSQAGRIRIQNAP